MCYSTRIEFISSTQEHLLANYERLDRFFRPLKSTERAMYRIDRGWLMVSRLVVKMEFCRVTRCQ